MAQGAVAPEFKHFSGSKSSPLEEKAIGTALSAAFTFCGGTFVGGFGYPLYDSIVNNQSSIMHGADILMAGFGLTITAYGILMGYLTQENKL